MRTLILDIETRPNLAYLWELWGDQSVSPKQLVEEKRMMCFAAKWLGSGETVFRSTFHDGKVSMVMAVWSLLDEADVVVHFNGKRFDMPHINREFLTHQFPPPSPYRQVDLFRTVKSVFKFPRNSLAYVAHELGLAEKGDTGGFELWLDCMAGDAAAWDRMRDYNCQDVTVTEALHDRLLPWIPSYPSHAAYQGADVCPQCGSPNLVREGHAYTQGGSYQRYRCSVPACGRWSRATRRDTGTQIVGVAA
jgi:hypothetical protein